MIMIQIFLEVLVGYFVGLFVPAIVRGVFLDGIVGQVNLLIEVVDIKVINECIFFSWLINI